MVRRGRDGKGSPYADRRPGRPAAHPRQILANGGLGALAENKKGGLDDRLFATGWIALVALIIRIAIREDKWQYPGSLIANRIKPCGVDA